MAYKFNYRSSHASFEQGQSSGERREDNIPKKEAVEIWPQLSVEVVQKLACEVSEVDLEEFKLKHLSSAVALKYLREHDSHWHSIMAAEERNSDLIPGVYEGGMKIWEGSLDLAKHLVEHECIAPGLTVLELGCGAGLPGIVAYLMGAHVTFQDYNEEVLNSVTIANVVLNTKESAWHKIPRRCRFIAGDWENIQHKYFGPDSNTRLYDIILTAETIYSRQNHKKLLRLMKHSLRRGGAIYLSAKDYYFGVGGGTADFESLLYADGVFDVSECFCIEDKAGGIGRKIYVIKFRDPREY